MPDVSTAHQEIQRLLNTGIHQIFEARVAKTPDAPCIRYQGKSLSFQQVNQQANRLAHDLRQRGLRPGHFVAVLVNKKPSMIISFLAIVKTGSAYVPMDPEAPLKRLKFMLEDLQTQWVLCPKGLAKVGEDLGVTPIFFEDILLDKSLSNTNLTIKSCGNLPAYIMYTSGTTGKPKGAVIHHRGIVRLIFETNYAHIDTHSVFLQGSSPAFDAATYEIWGPMLQGAQLVCIEKESFLDPNTFGTFLKKEGITHLFLTTGLFNVFAHEKPGIFSGLTSLLTGGEAMNIDMARKLLQLKDRPTSFCNMYGPTENTTYSTFQELDAEQLAGSRASIGKTISYSTTVIVDEKGKKQAIGEPGELLVGGLGLAQGYWQRPGLTAEKFIPNAFSDEPGARMYCTGDKVAYLPDERIDFLGRIDFQIKLRGFRIELGEIQKAVTELTGVRDARVLLREDQPGDKRLVAYWLANESEKITQDDEQLAGALEASLPGYMVPGIWVRMEAFPLTASGKVDRKALPKPNQDYQKDGQPSAGEDQLPSNPIETKLAELWVNLLNIDTPLLTDDFFSLGGTQDLGDQLLKDIEAVFQASLTQAQLKASSTLSALGQLILDDLRRQVGGKTEAPKWHKRPLFPSQQGTLALAPLSSKAHHHATAYILTGALQAGLLEQASQLVLQKHPILRTSIQEEDGEFAQIIRTELNSSVSHFDLQKESSASQEEAIKDALHAGATESLDHTQGPLWHCQTIQLGEETFLLALHAHRIILDSLSLDLLFNDLGHAYQALLDKKDSVGSENPDFDNFFQARQTQIEHPSFVKTANYWKQKLADLPPAFTLPERSISSDSSDWRLHHLQVDLTKSETHDLKQLGSQLNTTPFGLFLTIFKLQLAQASEQPDLVVATYATRRNRKAWEPLIGPISNPVLLRTHLAKATSFSQALTQVKQTLNGAYAHSEIPFAQLVNQIEDLSSSQVPPIRIHFDWRQEKKVAGSFADLAVNPYPITQAFSPFEIKLVVRELGDHIRMDLCFSPQTYDLETMDAFGEQLLDLARWCAKYPHRSLAARTQASAPPAKYPGATLVKPKAIGKPMKHREVFILDENLCLIPAGALGEICIGGRSLARGYMNQPRLTAERFLPHPFSASPGARLYRTGELGRKLPNGELAYMEKREYSPIS